MKKTLNLGVIGIDHGHIFDMLDEMIKEGCSCGCFWTEGDPLTLQEFNKKYPDIKIISIDESFNISCLFSFLLTLGYFLLNS